MLVSKECWERGCSCYDDRADKDPVKVVKREWKVFWVVAWSTYYPGRGLTNVRSTHQTLEEANEAAKKLESLWEFDFDYIKVEDVSEMLGIEEKNT